MKTSHQLFVAKGPTGTAMGDVVLPGAIVLVTFLSGTEEGEIRDVGAK